MDAKPRSVLLFVLAWTAVSLATPFTFAAGPSGAADPIPALLSEVRALRLTVERYAAVAPRVQLLVARLNVEEQRTTNASSHLDRVRRQLAEASVEAKKTADEIDDTERNLLTTAEEKIRKSWESEVVSLKRKLATQTAAEQQLRTRENEIAQEMATEQARWNELSVRIDELERLLGPIPQQSR